MISALIKGTIKKQIIKSLKIDRKNCDIVLSRYIDVNPDRPENSHMWLVRSYAKLRVQLDRLKTCRKRMLTVIDSLTEWRPNK